MLIIIALMILFFSALDHHANHRDFSCALSSLEANCDFLSSLVAQGNTLLMAYVIENDVRTNLPLAAFDGFPVSAGIEALQTEWRSVLSEQHSVNSIHRKEMITLIRQRIYNLERSIISHERMTNYFGRWLERIRERSKVGPMRSQLVYQYETQVTYHQAQLCKVCFHKNLAANRLDQLLA